MPQHGAVAVSRQLGRHLHRDGPEADAHRRAVRPIERGEFQLGHPGDAALHAEFENV